MLSHTARARPFLRCSPFLSRQKERNETGYKYGYKYGRTHVQSSGGQYTSPKSILLVPGGGLEPPQPLRVCGF